MGKNCKNKRGSINDYYPFVQYYIYYNLDKEINNYNFRKKCNNC